MNSLVVIITDSEFLARAAARCIDTTLGTQIETVYMTYATSRLSHDMLQRTDLFVLGLFRRDALGLRAEGLYVAEKFATAARRSLLIAERAVSDVIRSPFYWDVSAKDHLPDRVLRLLGQAPPSAYDFASVRSVFKSHCRPACDRHR